MDKRQDKNTGNDSYESPVISDINPVSIVCVAGESTLDEEETGGSIR